MPISNINSMTCIGRLVRESELRYTKNGKSVCKFSIAINRSEKRDGEYSNFPTYLNVVTLGAMAENVSKYLGKGSLVGITGELRGRKYEDKEGNKRYNYDLIANNVQFLDGVKKDSYEEEVKPKPKKKVEPKPEPEDSYDNQEEEIPF